MSEGKTFARSLRSLFTGKRPFSARLRLAFFPALAFSFILFFFGPLDLSYVSRNYVNYSAWDSLPYTALVMGAVFVFLLLAASIPGGPVHAFLVSVYAGISIAMYVQGAFLNPDFGTLDGRTINWQSFSSMMLLNLVVWFVILLIPHLVHYFSNRAWRGFVMVSCAALILMQGISLGVKLADQRNIDKNRSADYYLTAENMLRVGSKQNIAVFLLDTTSSSDVHAMLEKYPDALAAFRDFTWYENANSHYMFTVPSLVSFLTGENWDCEKDPIRNYMDGAWHTEKASSFYTALKEKEFERNFYMLLPEAAKDPAVLDGIFSNLVQSDKARSVDRLAFLKLFKLSFYRYFPLMMKPFFVIYTTDISGLLTRQDAMEGEWDFVSRMNSQTLQRGKNGNAFFFYYLQGSHRPYRMDDRGRLISSDLAPEYLTNYSEKEDQIAGFFYLIGDYMRQLKEMGLYDSTGIIILADHGNNAEASADHQPIYFVKMPGESHDVIRMSSAPITIQDSFQADVMEMAGEDGSLWGTPSALVPEEAAERWTMAYAKDKSYPKLDGASYNVMHVYRYIGDRDELIRLWQSEDYETIPMVSSFY